MVRLEEVFQSSGRRGMAWIAAVLLVTALAVGQQTQAPAQPSPPAQATPQGQSHADAGANAPGQSAPGAKAATPEEQKPEHLVTDKEAKELFRSVDKITKFASKETKLPIREQVKREMVNRDQVESYIKKRMDEDEDVQRMQRSEAVLKKFGLLPRSFDLRSFFVAMLREQVAGYYDPKTKTVNLLNWVEPAVQEPVLAHELTHALQDQSFDLDRWMKQGVEAEIKPISDSSPQRTQRAQRKEDQKTQANQRPKSDAARDDVKENATEIQTDEQEAARLAVVEGQAMLVLVDYMLAPTDQSVVDSPGVVDAIKQGMMVGDNSPIFNKAPLYLKESLTFAYRYGLDFEKEILLKKGKEAAFSGVFKHPPDNERQIMEPAAYLADEHLPALGIPDFGAIVGPKYEKFDVGSFGEFDVSVLIKQFSGTEASERLTPAWRGGYYYAARRKGETKGPLAVVYVSRWATPEDAAELAEIYSKSVKTRYKSAVPVKRPEELDIAQYVPVGFSRVPQRVKAPMEWMTDEGRVTVERHGDLVIAMESFDRESADKLRDAVLAVNKISY
jgi:hypothetical protein